MNRSTIFYLILIAICGIAITILVPYLFTMETCFKDYETTGQIGDTINGIAGPFLTIGLAIFSYLAYNKQVENNKQQQTNFNEEKNLLETQISEQKEFNKIQQFENTFFEMLKIHIDNVKDMEIGNGVVKGRKCFVQMYYEMRAAIGLSVLFGETRNISKEEGTENGYLIFFWGIGPNSFKNYRHDNNGIAKPDIEFIEKVYNKIIEKTMDAVRKNQFIDFIKNELKMENDNKSYTVDLNLFDIMSNSEYHLFEGHLHRLDIYFRHLYQLIGFVVESDFGLEDDKKYQYIKIIRAQLTDHEQLLIYYNSLSKLGKIWHEKEYFTKWKIIKNMPVNLAYFGITPIECFDINKNCKELEGYIKYNNQDIFDHKIIKPIKLKSKDLSED